MAPNPLCCRAARCHGPDAWAGPGSTPCARRAAAPATRRARCALRPCTARRASSVRRPRSVRKLSNAPPVRPRQLAHQPSCSCSSFVAAMTAPPTTSLWPLMYLVVECTHDVGAQLERLLPGRRQEGVVHHDQRALAFAPFCDQCGDVGDAQQRIAGRFDPQHVGLLCQRRIQRGCIGEAHEIHLQLIALVPGGEQPEGAAVAVVRRDDARALRQQVPHQRDGAHAGAGDDAARAALEVRQRIAQQVARGIAGARIVVGALVAVAAEGIGGRQVNRRHDRTGDIVGLEAGAHRRGGEFGRSLKGILQERTASTARSCSASFRKASWPSSEENSCRRASGRRAVSARMSAMGTSWSSRTATTSVRTGMRVASTWCRSMDSDRQMKDSGRVRAA